MSPPTKKSGTRDYGWLNQAQAADTTRPNGRNRQSNSPSPSVVSIKDAATPSKDSPALPPPPAKENGNLKRKREVNIVYSQPDLTGFGEEVGTRLLFANQYLKERNTDEKTVNDILGHLSLMRASDKFKQEFVDMLRTQPRIQFIPARKVTEQTWDRGTYKYRPLIPGVTNAQTLLTYLKNRRESGGLPVKDLKDGWPTVEKELAAIEAEESIVVIRTKKENVPKHVFLNNKGLAKHVDPEWKNHWYKMSMPKSDEIVKRLKSAGVATAGEDKGGMVKGAEKKEKKKSVRKIGKVTNTHMQDILKDFSSMKR